MKYTIVCDAKRGKELGISILALVDRSKVNDMWWTSDQPNLILFYHNKSAANFAMSRIQHRDWCPEVGNFRIVPLNKAKQIIQDQRDAIHEFENERLEEEAALAEDNPLW